MGAGRAHLVDGPFRGWRVEVCQPRPQRVLSVVEGDEQACAGGALEAPPAALELHKRLPVGVVPPLVLPLPLQPCTATARLHSARGAASGMSLCMSCVHATCGVPVLRGEDEAPPCSQQQHALALVEHAVHGRTLTEHQFDRKSLPCSPWVRAMQ